MQPAAASTRRTPAQNCIKKAVLILGMGVGKLRQVLEDAGVEPIDIPKAIVLHELLGIGFAAATWGVQS